MSQDNQNSNEGQNTTENGNEKSQVSSDTMKIVEPLPPEGLDGDESHRSEDDSESSGDSSEELNIEELEQESLEEQDVQEEEYVAPTEEEWNECVAEYERVKSELDSMTTRLKSLSTAYTKKQEEVELIRKRFQRDAKIDEVKRRGEVVKVLFEPLENLKRSIDTQQKAGIDESHIQGLLLVHKNFMKCFHNMGLEEIPGVGSKFDPNLHEALMQIPVQQELQDNVVMNVHSTGYQIEGIILRPSQVIVGKYTAPPQEVNEEEQSEQSEIQEQDSKEHQDGQDSDI